MRLMKQVMGFTLFLLAANISVLCAQWTNDATVNTVVCNAAKDQREAAVVGNAFGQVMVFWRDYRSEASMFGGDIYTQKLDSNGNKMMPDDGSVVFTGINGQFGPRAISDDHNGAIISWLSNRGGFYENDVFAQRLSADGTLLWQASAVPVSVMNGTASNLAMTGDKAGGAIIVWQYLTGSYDIYAQRIDSSGTVLWGTNGLTVCTAAESQMTPVVTTDGSGGAIIAWQDSRNGIGMTDIYAQRISADGQALWQTDGVFICAAENGQSNPQIISDNQGGAIIVWDDLRTLNSADIYAQRINADGALQWSANGVAVCTAASEQSNPVVVPDGTGGALVAWHDRRSNSAYDIYAQRINAAGQTQWAANGVAVCIASHNQQYPQAVADGSGGMLLCWQDDRSGDLGDIYAQRVAGSGAVLWNADGAAICLAGGYQANPALVGDGRGGAVIAWEDQRNGADFNIYAQQINSDGNLADVTSIDRKHPSQPMDFTLHQNYPNPFNPITSIRYQLAEKTVVSLSVYNTQGQVVKELVNSEQAPGKYRLTFNARDLPTGVYFYRLRTNGRFKVRKMLYLR